MRNPNSRQPRAVHALKRSPFQMRLFWPAVLLMVVLPIVAWEIASAERNSRSGTAPSRISHGKSGPWGNLEYVSIAIELPDRFIDTEQTDPVEWVFAGSSRERVEEFVKGCALTDVQKEALLKAPWRVGDHGVHVNPTDELVWNLGEKARAQIYAELGRSEANIDQYYAFTYRPERLPERLEFCGLQEETISMFKELLYPQGSLLRFGDSDLVLRKLQDKHERLRFVKTISRRSTLLVKLEVRPESNIDQLVNYWGMGGRSKDLRPLLESLSRVPGGCKIDIAHLLPPFARKRIYTYPDPEKESAGIREDCHWSSLNFFNDSPEPRFAQPEELTRAISTEYDTLPGLADAQFGDVIFLKNKDGFIVHSAVYIADDVVFTKNGAGSNQPWIYLKIEDMVPYYIQPGDTIQVFVARKKQV
jgi:hypothetical protein